MKRLGCSPSKYTHRQLPPSLRKVLIKSLRGPLWHLRILLSLQVSTSFIAQVYTESDSASPRLGNRQKTPPGAAKLVISA